MIHRIVQFALQQRFVVLMFTVLIVVAGAVSFQRMPVDAYPDLSPNGPATPLRKSSGSPRCLSSWP